MLTSLPSASCCKCAVGADNWYLFCPKWPQRADLIPVLHQFLLNSLELSKYYVVPLGTQEPNGMQIMQHCSWGKILRGIYWYMQYVRWFGHIISTSIGSKHFQVVLFGRIATLLPLFAKNNYRLTNLEPQQEAKRIIRQHLHKNHPKYPHRSTSASAVSIPKSSSYHGKGRRT